MANTFNPDWNAVTAPLNELNEINKQASEEIIRATISFYTDSFGTSQKYVQTMPRTTNPQDFFRTQLALLAEQSSKVLEYTKNVSEICQNALQQQVAWAEEGLDHAIKTTVPKHPKRSPEAM